MKTIRILINFLCFAVFTNTTLYSQILDFDSLYQNNPEYKETIKSLYKKLDIFEDKEVMKISIESDFKSLVKNKFKGEYQPAVLKYNESDSVVVTRHIKIKPRGNMRRRTCQYPPLKLNFPKKEVVIKMIKEFDKMKMVVKCSKAKINEQYLLSEYYAYKIFNTITDYSFRVKLIEVTYIDTGGKYKTGASYAYIIESIDQLAMRHGSSPVETAKIADHLTNQNQLALVYLFQYFIGNTDWSVSGRHNMAMIKPEESDDRRPFPIPYDFDNAGIVNTNYATPDPSLGIESVRERLYRGLCLDEDVVKQASEQFIHSKEAIYEIYNNSGLLDKAVLTNTLHYIDEFYRIIENENSFRSNILDMCRK